MKVAQTLVGGLGNSGLEFAPLREPQIKVSSTPTCVMHLHHLNVYV